MAAAVNFVLELRLSDFPQLPFFGAEIMAQITRRQFLEDSLLAAAVAAAIPAASVLAADTTSKKKATPEKAGDLLQVAIVGAGGRGGEHISQFLANPHTEIAYIVDADEKIGQRRAKRSASGRAKRPSSFATSARPSTTSRWTSSPPPRPTTGTPCARSGPCRPARTSTWRSRSATTSAKAAAWSQAARKHHRICQAGTQCRSMKGTIDAIEYVQAGKIGEVKLARGLCYKRRKSIGPKGNYEVPPQVDYNLWARPGADAAADAAEVPLRLALAAGMGQRRHGQPGPAPDGHRPLGPGPRSPGRPRDRLRRAAGLRRRRRRGQHRGGASSSSATRRSSSRSAAWRPIRSAAPASA